MVILLLRFCLESRIDSFVGHLVLRNELKSLDPFLMLDHFSGTFVSNPMFFKCDFPSV